MKDSIFKNKDIKSFFDFFSRVAISAIFISAIPGKINNFEKTVEYISSKDYITNFIYSSSHSNYDLSWI